MALFEKPILAENRDNFSNARTGYKSAFNRNTENRRPEEKLSYNTAMLRCSKMLKSIYKNKDSSENQHE